MSDDQPPPIERPTCADCPYYKPVSESCLGKGKCLRRPPVLNPAVAMVGAVAEASEWTPKRVLKQLENDYDFAGVWWQPTVCDDDTCGEHPDFPAYIQATRSRRDAT